MTFTFDHLVFPALLLIVSVLYASVGQAGGTGYIAVMGLMGFSPDTIKPTALSLNILVAAIGCFQFYRVGLLTWRVCYPFAILGVPFSVLGGATNLAPAIYQPVVGALLIFASAQTLYSLRSAKQRDENAPKNPPFVVSLLTGGVIGFVAGVTGVGGGIFLAPLVLAFGWVGTRQASAVSASFNLLNSAAALAGAWTKIAALPAELPVWLVVVAIGAFIGSWFGSRHLSAPILRVILVALLFAAGSKMLIANS